MKTETAPETSEAVMDPLPYEAIRVVQLPILGSFAWRILSWVKGCHRFADGTIQPFIMDIPHSHPWIKMGNVQTSFQLANHHGWEYTN